MITVQKAGSLLCPYNMDKESLFNSMKCVTIACMAWVKVGEKTGYCSRLHPEINANVKGNHL